MKRSFLLLPLLLLGACTILPERSTTDLYSLPEPAITASDTSQRDVSLRLARPDTSDTLGSNRILVTRDGIGFQAYPSARWTAQVPLLWRDRLLDAFWRDGRFAALSTSADGLRADYELGGMLRALHMEEDTNGTRAVIRFDARLVDTSERRILASRRFEVREPASGTAVTDSVRALGRAADTLARELITWTDRNSP